MNFSSVFGQDWKNQLDNFLNSELNKFPIPDVEILVVNKDSILYSKSKGTSSPKSMYYIGSVSKSLTAYGVLKLIEQNKISFETKVTDILPQLHFRNSANEITVWHLLTHTSGINKNNGFLFLPTLNGLKVKRFEVSNENINPLHHEYSNLNYAILGLIIESTSGLSFEDFMEEFVFEPLEMEHSKIGSRDKISSELLNHYQYFGPFPIKSKQVNYSLTAIPAGFICSSAQDLGKYIQLNLSNGKLNNVSKTDSKLLEIMHTVWNNEDVGYAMGWKKGRYNDHTFYQHLGSTAVSYSGIFFIPDKDLGFVLLTNSNSIGFSENMAEGILNILTDGKKIKVSRFEWFLRIGVLVGYFLVIGIFIINLFKLIRNKWNSTLKKQIKSISIQIVSLILVIFLFPLIAQIPFVSLLKLQPDIGYLILISLILPIILTLIKIRITVRQNQKT